MDVRLVLPSHAEVSATLFAARAAYGDLLEAGAHMYEMQNAVPHSQLATIDGVWSVGGLQPLSPQCGLQQRGGRGDSGPCDGIAGGNPLREDVAESHPISLARWRARSPHERLREMRACCWRYWMWAARKQTAIRLPSLPPPLRLCAAPPRRAGSKSSRPGPGAMSRRRSGYVTTRSAGRAFAAKRR